MSLANGWNSAYHPSLTRKHFINLADLYLPHPDLVNKECQRDLKAIYTAILDLPSLFGNFTLWPMRRELTLMYNCQKDLVNTGTVSWGNNHIGLFSSIRTLFTLVTHQSISGHHTILAIHCNVAPAALSLSNLWDHFYNKTNLFMQGRLHLKGVGSARLGRLLNDSVSLFR